MNNLEVSVYQPAINQARILFCYLMEKSVCAHISSVRAQPRLTLCDPVDCIPQGSSVREIFQVENM